MKSWDVVIVGGGIIGLSLSIELRKRNARVLIVERGEPGREASYAAAGMLAHLDVESSSPLKPLVIASARMYPDFVHELEEESGINCDLRDHGTLQFTNGHSLAAKQIADMEPALAQPSAPIVYLKELSVDPKGLSNAVLQVARHRGVDIVSGSKVLEVLVSENKAAGVRTETTNYTGPVVVTCAGAWSGQFSPIRLPTRPVKGQLLSVVSGEIPRHVIRSPEVYLVPRTDGRLVIGSTMEEAGFDKRIDPATIGRLREAAIKLCPSLKQSRTLEVWAGLRPGTPDSLPIVGTTSISGYFVGTGHFRDGILLAPVTARLMAQVIAREKPDYDLSPFSASRFE